MISHLKSYFGKKKKKKIINIFMISHLKSFFGKKKKRMMN